MILRDNDITETFRNHLEHLNEFLAHVQSLYKQQTLDEQPLRQIKRDINASAKEILLQLEQFKGLVHTSALITSSLDLEQVLNEVIDTIIYLTNAERAYVMLYARDTSDLSIRVARNWDGEIISEKDVVFSRQIIQHTLEKGESILTTNAQEDERFNSAASVRSNKLRSIICIPLKLQNTTIGVFYADNPITAGIFPLSMLPLMNTFANHVAIAISNARRYEKVKTDLEETKRQVVQLQIQLDQSQIDEQFSALSETDYFKRLEEIASDIRNQFNTDT